MLNMFYALKGSLSNRVNTIAYFQQLHSKGGSEFCELGDTNSLDGGVQICLVLSEVCVLLVVVCNGVIVCPSYMGARSQDYLAFKEGVVWATVKSSLIIYGEGSAAVHTIEVNEAVVEEGQGVRLGAVSHEPGEDPFASGQGV